MTYTEMRALYARSRFIVVPLLPSDTDNGITVILEAMAMGKAVICSRTTGQVDAVRDGQTGMYVTQGDPRALRQAIGYLWDNPAIAEQMGKEGRRVIEREFTLDHFVARVREVSERVLAERRTSRG
jgi:glycosyltransferase involved in cell wall biosynthesis